MIGLIERILDHLGVHPGQGHEEDEARLLDMERRLAALDTRAAVTMRRERARLRELARQDAEDWEVSGGDHPGT